MVALFTSAELGVSYDDPMRWAVSMLLTRRIVLREDERAGSAVQLRASVEYELVRWLACISHCASHVIGRAVDDEVAEDILALPESAVSTLR